MKIRLEPMLDRVVIEPLSAASKSKGGIIIPDSAKEPPLKGYVREVGPGKKDEPMYVSPGDLVLFNKAGAQDIEIDGKPHVIVRQDAIDGKLHGEAIPEDTSALKPVGVLPTDERHSAPPRSHP